MKASNLCHFLGLSTSAIVFQFFDRFPTLPMSLLLCVHTNIVFQLLYLHFAIGLLEVSDLDMVTNELDSVSSKWYTLGQGLLFKRQLDSIHAQNLQDNQLCLKKVLSTRIMKYPTTTWSDIIASLKSSGDSQLADCLETKYSFRELTTTSILHSNEM